MNRPGREWVGLAASAARCLGLAPRRTDRRGPKSARGFGRRTSRRLCHRRGVGIPGIPKRRDDVDKSSAPRIALRVGCERAFSEVRCNGGDDVVTIFHRRPPAAEMIKRSNAAREIERLVERCRGCRHETDAFRHRREGAKNRSRIHGAEVRPLEIFFADRKRVREKERVKAASSANCAHPSR